MPLNLKQVLQDLHNCCDDNNCDDQRQLKRRRVSELRICELSKCTIQWRRVVQSRSLALLDQELSIYCPKNVRSLRQLSTSERCDVRDKLFPCRKCRVCLRTSSISLPISSCLLSVCLSSLSVFVRACLSVFVPPQRATLVSQ